jgi:membrane-associated protease RseP (regulator of RpoE activity)
MVSTLTWVLAGLLAYTAVAMGLRDRGLLPDSVRVSGPLTTIHTQRGRALLDKLAAPRRAWRAWGNFGLGFGLVVLAGSFLLVVVGAIDAVRNPTPTALNQPRNVLAIPGVNDFLPLSVAPEIVTGLVVGLVVHEGGHGLLCRVEDIDIESMGLALFAIIPIGAFVEPDEEKRAKASRGAQLRMFTAGVTNNFAISILALLLLFGPVMGSIAVVDGVAVGGVLAGSPAADGGLERGDVVTAVDGTAISDQEALSMTLANATGTTAQLQLRSGDSVTVRRSVVVMAASPRAPLSMNTTITAVDGTPVRSEQAFQSAAADTEFGTVTLANGSERAVAFGTLGQVAADGPLAAAGAPAEEDVIVTQINDSRTLTASALQDALAGKTAGDRVSVVAYHDNERQVYNVTMAPGPQGNDGIIGLARITRGVSGFAVTDLGIDGYPAGAFLDLLGGDPESGGAPELPFTQQLFTILILPFAGVSTGLGYNFAGFTGIATNFYVAEGLLAGLGTDGVFLLANLLFWTGWINLVIGQFNLIPTYPLDGGHIMRGSTDAVVARLPIENRKRLSFAITATVTATMIIGLIVMLFGPQFLA